MSTQTTGNKCPRCKQNQLRVIQQDDGSTTGVCHNCGYKLFQPSPNQQRSGRSPTGFTEIMSFINNYAFVIAIVGMLIAFISMSGIGSLSAFTTTSIDEINQSIDSNFDTLNSSINITNNNLSNQFSLIGHLQNDVLTIQGQITELTALNQNVTILEELVSAINQTITVLNNKYVTEQSFLSNTNCTLKITEYPNQNMSDGSIFAEVEITISGLNNTLHDTLLKMYYEDSVWNVTGSDNDITPINSTLSEGYVEVIWIENCNEHHVEFRLEWDTLTYATTEVDEDELITSLQVNNLYFNFNTERDNNYDIVQ